MKDRIAHFNIIVTVKRRRDNYVKNHVRFRRFIFNNISVGNYMLKVNNRNLEQGVKYGQI